MAGRFSGGCPGSPCYRHHDRRVPSDSRLDRPSARARQTWPHLAASPRDLEDHGSRREVLGHPRRSVRRWLVSRCWLDAGLDRDGRAVGAAVTERDSVCDAAGLKHQQGHGCPIGRTMRGRCRPVALSSPSLHEPGAGRGMHGSCSCRNVGVLVFRASGLCSGHGTGVLMQ